ncbi:MAG: hypothetical protein R3F34_15910 [Planctomycetota bacterium]
MEQYVIAGAVVVCAAVVGVVSSGGHPYQAPDLDPSTAASSALGPTGSRRVSISVDGAPAAVPTPSEEAAARRANEAEAIAVLRRIAAAQADFQASAAVDLDGDGNGEFGYLGELCGTIGLRGSDGARGAALGEPLLDPYACVPTSSGNARHQGYLFAVQLPDDEARGVPEAVGGGAPTIAPFPDADLAERYWCAYAWPIAAGSTGDRAFFVDHDGVVLATDPLQRRYSGDASAPRAESALDARFRHDLSGALPGPLAVSVDGLTWTRVDDSDR